VLDSHAAIYLRLRQHILAKQAACSHVGSFISLTVDHIFVLTPRFVPLQVAGTISPIDALAVASLSIELTPSLLNVSASGTVSAMPVSVQLTSAPHPADSTLNINSITVTSAVGASLEALLASQASQLATDMGITIPTMDAWAGAQNSSRSSTAQFVFDSKYGLRMFNISLPSSSKLSLSDLAKRVGFDWGGSASTEGGADPVIVSGASITYVPSKPAAPSLQWNGKLLADREFSIAALMDVPSLGITAVRGMLQIEPGSKLKLQVRPLSPNGKTAM
jgi:hypothetical protein